MADDGTNYGLRRHPIIILLTVLAVLTVVGQPRYRQRTFTVHDGLPSNAITAIRQDHNGLVWIATWYGLCLYDGTRFTTFPGNGWGDTDALSTHRISMIEIDSRDNVWLRTYDGGLYLFDTRECRYHNMKELLRKAFGKTISPRNIYCLPTGYTWITDEKTELNLRIDDRYPTLADCMKVIGSKDIYGKYIRKVEVDKRGREWIITDMGMKRYGSREVKKGVFTNVSDGNADSWNEYVRLFPDMDKRMIDQQGNLWFSSPKGLTLVNFSTQHARLLPVELSKPTRAVVCLRDGTVWAASTGGVVTVYGKQGNATGDYSLQRTLRNFAEYIYTMYEDRRGNLWIGTRGQGLYRLSADGNVVGHYRHSDDDRYSLSHDVVFDITEDESGHLWIATYGGGINMVADDGSGFSDAVVPRFLHAGNEMKQYPMDEFAKVRRITHDGRGTMLVSTTGGLLTFPSTARNVQSLRFCKTRNVEGDTTSLRTSDVMQVLVCGDHSIYVATMGGGIQRIVSGSLLHDQLKMQSVREMNRGAGNVLSMVEDKQGGVWIVRESETDLYDIKTGQLEQFAVNNIDEQTILTEAKPAVGQDGRVWMGAMGGVLTFDPKRMQKSRFVPHIVYTSCLFQGERELHSILNNTVLTIEDVGQRNVTVNFAALDYRDNYLVQYAYRMKESDDGWNYIGCEPRVSFSGLSPGRHTLVVKSTNCDGVWVDNETELVIDVRPMLWERLGVRILLLLLVIALVTAAIITYLNHRRTLHEREQRLENLLRQYSELQHRVPTRKGYSLKEPQIEDADERMMNTLMKFVEQHIGNEGLKVEEMAEAVGMGRSAFYGKVKELVGVSPSDFLRQMRMQRACQLLTKSKLSISEIAYAVGFNDPKYFAKCFKKDMGKTPSEYRL